MRRSATSLLALFVFLSFTPEARTCQICLPMPTESLADRILTAEHIVLAREHPEQPYQLQAVRRLKGDLTKAPPLDVFLDSSSRRQLASNPDLSLLCGWFAEKREWRRLAVHGETTAPVVASILGRAAAWKADSDERLRYFAGFLASEDPELSDLAHIEVARAPYSKLLPYADRIPREQLHEKLRNFRRMEWHALYILFLSRSEDPRDHEFIRDGLADVARYNLATRTAPFATALIEIDGAAAIEKLTELYLRNPDRRPEEFAAIHAALKIHGNEGSPGLRDSIVAAYGQLLERQPSLAPELADDLSRWRRFDHAEAFSNLLANTMPDISAVLRIRAHLRAARTQNALTPPEQSGSMRPALAIAGGLMIFPLLLAILGRSKARAA